MDPRENMSDAQALYRMAREAMRHAYVPYSGFPVGAALLTESGGIYTGANVENASFGATICAERTAVACAVSAGERVFSAIAVAAEGEAFPCGICRQFLFEFGDDLLFIIGPDETHLRRFAFEELMPHGFRLEEPAKQSGEQEDE